MFSGFRIQPCVWTELFSRAFYWSTEEECTWISAVIADSLKRLRRCSDQWCLLSEPVPRGWSVTNGWRLLLSSARVADSWLGNRRVARLGVTWKCCDQYQRSAHPWGNGHLRAVVLWRLELWVVTFLQCGCWFNIAVYGAVWKVQGTAFFEVLSIASCT